MMNESLFKSQSEERQYLKVVMECIHYLARQGIALRENSFKRFAQMPSTKYVKMSADSYSKNLTKICYKKVHALFIF